MITTLPGAGLFAMDLLTKYLGFSAPSSPQPLEEGPKLMLSYVFDLPLNQHVRITVGQEVIRDLKSAWWLELTKGTKEMQFGLLFESGRRGGLPYHRFRKSFHIGADKDPLTLACSYERRIHTVFLSKRTTLHCLPNLYRHLAATYLSKHGMTEAYYDDSTRIDVMPVNASTVRGPGFYDMTFTGLSQAQSLLPLRGLLHIFV